ncbi:hypothetical protein EVAR_99434_1, partial [Eumeta japonica]
SFSFRLEVCGASGDHSGRRESGGLQDGGSDRSGSDQSRGNGGCGDGRAVRQGRIRHRLGDGRRGVDVDAGLMGDGRRGHGSAIRVRAIERRPSSGSPVPIDVDAGSVGNCGGGADDGGFGDDGARDRCHGGGCDDGGLGADVEARRVRDGGGGRRVGEQAACYMYPCPLLAIFTFVI